MEEEKVFEEQLSLETEGTSSDNSSAVEENEDASKENAQLGEPIGKFKNSKELFDAYNSLQAEFTRKSQRLAALEKENAPDEQTENGLKAFLSKNQEAFAYADQLKKQVQNEELHDEAAFERAWAKILYEKLSGGAGAEFQNLILKDDNVKNLVIEDYVKTLQKQNTPYVMSTDSGQRVTRGVTPKPDSFEKAKETVFELLGQKR